MAHTIPSLSLSYKMVLEYTEQSQEKNNRWKHQSSWKNMKDPR